MKARLAALIVLTVTATCAQAQSMHWSSTTELRSALRNFQASGEVHNGDLSPEDYANREIAFGYVMGVADFLELNNQVCPPPGSTNGQLIAVTVKYMDDHPDLWHYGSPFLVSRALERAFPCKEP